MHCRFLQGRPNLVHGSLAVDQENTEHRPLPRGKNDTLARESAIALANAHVDNYPILALRAWQKLPAVLGDFLQHSGRLASRHVGRITKPAICVKFAA